MLEASHLIPTLAIVALTLVALVLLISALKRVRRTTLVSAWGWSLAAVVAVEFVALGRALAGPEQADLLEALQLAAASLTFCPVVSLLGSKRPQHAAWNFVVLSLWAIVTLPAAEALLMQRGQHLEVGDARGWFLWILLLLGPINYLPTKFWLGSLLVLAAQVLLLSEHLPLVRRSLVAQPALGALALLVAAMLWAAWKGRRAAAKDGYDRLWVDFRNAFGLLWALRVQERVNAAATMYGWPFVLVWSGFVDAESGQPIVEFAPETEKALRQNLKGLLRRFVSPEWIGERLAGDLD